MIKDYRRRRTALETILETVEIYTRHFLPLFSVFVFTLPFAFLRNYVWSNKQIPAIKGTALALDFFIADFILLMVVTAMVSMICTGNQASLRLSLQFVKKRWVWKMITSYSLILAMIWVGIYSLQWIMDAPFPPLWRWIGGLVTVAVILICFSFWMFVPCVVTLEQKSGWVALRRSRQLGAGFYLRNLAVVLTLKIPAVLIWLLFWVLNFLLPVPDIVNEFGVLEDTARILLLPLAPIATGLIYIEMRNRKEGPSRFDLAEELAN